MKKKAIIFLLCSTMIGTSVAPVSAAEEKSQEAVQETIAEETTIFVDTDSTEEIPDLAQENPDSEDLSTDEIFGDESEISTEETEATQIDEPQEDLEEDFADDFMDDADVAVAEYISDSSNWKAEEENGTVRFLYISGYDDEGQPIYMTLENGIVEIDGSEYLFDSDGYMQTGRVEYEGSYYFFMDDENAEEQKGYAVSEDKMTDIDEIHNPCNSNLGQLQKDYWRWTGTAFEYYGEDGIYLSVPELKAKQLKEKSYLGYFEIHGFYFALQDNGVPRTGDYEIKDGNYPGLYYFYKTKASEEYPYPGSMARSTWVHLTTSAGERWRYYDETGRTTLAVKVTKLDKTIDPSVGDKEYLVAASGYLYKKIAKVKAADGNTYICNAQSVIYKNRLVTYNGARYYVTSSGKLSTYKNCWKRLSCAKNRPYYFGSTPGKISEKKGWVKITGSNGSYVWYLFTSNGNAYISTWKGNYYFNEKGAVASGMQTVDGKMYYFKPSTAKAHNGEVYKNTLITYNKKKYYAGSDGALYQKKWAKIDGGYYYFQSDGTLLTNAYVKRNKTYGYVDSTGKFTTGWIIVNDSANKVRYLNPDAKGYVKNTYKVIKGVRYYFDKDGYRVSDLTTYYPSNWKKDPVLVKIHNGSYAPYYLECDKTNGVITVYTGSDKTIPVKTVRTSVGKASTPTPSGTYTMTRSLRWQPLMGPSWGQYGTHVVSGIYVHSVAGSTKSIYSLPASGYDMLGTPASHGCMRVCVADAKWIYENCSGAKIRIFSGKAQSLECNKGPLGQDPLVPRYGSGTFDPTDPNV